MKDSAVRFMVQMPTDLTTLQLPLPALLPFLVCDTFSVVAVVVLDCKVFISSTNGHW